MRADLETCPRDEARQQTSSPHRRRSSPIPVFFSADDDDDEILCPGGSLNLGLDVVGVGISVFGGMLCLSRECVTVGFLRLKSLLSTLFLQARSWLCKFKSVMPPSNGPRGGQTLGRCRVSASCA